MIAVKKIKNNNFEVTVTETGTTTHSVQLSDNYYSSLTGKKISEEKLIEASFEFLLERESNTMILRSFDLTVIGQYFPEYESTIKSKF